MSTSLATPCNQINAGGYAVRALNHFNQNFGLVESLVQMFVLASGLVRSGDNNKKPEDTSPTAETWIPYAANQQIALRIQSTTRVPPWLLEEGGLDFLLRQAVIAACTALASYFWDILAENALSIVRVRGSRTEPELHKLVLTLGDLVELEQLPSVDERLERIVLRNFARGVLSDVTVIDKVSRLFGIRDIWEDIARIAEMEAGIMRRMVGELVARRNQIVHRADRQEPLALEQSGRLRPITYAWTMSRVQASRTVVTAASVVFESITLDLADALHKRASRASTRVSR